MRSRRVELRLLCVLPQHTFTTESFNLLPCKITQEFNMLICSEKLVCKQLHVVLKFLNLFGLRVIVFDWFVRNSSCLGSVKECRVVFGKVFIRWVQASYHATKCIATYTLSQQTGQLRVPVRNVYPTGILLGISQIIQSCDNLPQCKQRFVNFNTLFLSLTVDFGQLLPL